MNKDLEIERRKLLDRALKRDKEFETSALEASREGDDQGVWLAMAARAENKRFISMLGEHPDYPENVNLP